MRFLLFFLGVVVFMSSCISNKKVVFLQKNDVNVKGLKKDTVLRTYALDTFNYRIQPNDIISVKFESLTPKEYDFFSSGNVQQTNIIGSNALLFGEIVDENGEVNFPVIGKVKVMGLTIFAIQDKLQVMANQYLESPVVKVRLLNYRVTVLGEVLKEGSITLANNRTSLLEVIGLVGGLGELADRSNIKLIRQKGNTTEVQYINLLDERFIESPYYYVNQNDILIVPPLKQRPFRKYFGQNLALAVSTLTLLLFAINLSR